MNDIKGILKALLLIFLGSVTLMVGIAITDIVVGHLTLHATKINTKDLLFNSNGIIIGCFVYMVMGTLAPVILIITWVINEVKKQIQ